MRYGDLVTMFKEGIKISAQAIQPIGIFDRSECWAVWLADRDRSKGGRMPVLDHLVVSPFHPSSWPALFRIDLKLKAEAQALVAAAAALRDLDLNIVSYDITPGGHHHFAWSLIAEAVPFTHGNCRGVLTDGERMARKARRLDDARLANYTQNTLAPAMLTESARIEAQLLGHLPKGQDHPFLHPAFHSARRPRGSLLYDETRYSGKLRRSGERQRIRPVACRWLQGLAFFWLYRRWEREPMALQYLKEPGELRTWGPQAQTAMSERVHDMEAKDFRFPMKSLALFDSDEKYVRLVLSRAPASTRRYHMNLAYDATFSTKAPTSKGLLHKLFALLTVDGARVVHCSSAITGRREGGEANRIEVVGELPTLKRAGATASDAPLRRVVEAATCIADRRMKKAMGFTLKIGPGQVRIVQISADPLFISTRLKWPRLSALRRRINDKARELGFVPVWGDLPAAEFEHELGWSTTASGVTAIAEERIRKSRALLQIVPEPAKGADSNLHWMIHERGVAVGADVRRHVCLDTSARTLDAWRAEFRVLADEPVTLFDGRAAGDAIVATIAEAIRALRG